MSQTFPSSHYMEKLPDELAQVIVAEAYDPKLSYCLITDTDGSYITAYDKETGERANLSNSADGISDDMELDVEEFQEIADALEEYDEERDYSKFTLILIPILLSSIILMGALVWYFSKVFL